MIKRKLDCLVQCFKGLARCGNTDILLLCDCIGSYDSFGELQQVQQQLLQVCWSLQMTTYLEYQTRADTHVSHEVNHT